MKEGSMPKWPISDAELREMYRGGAGNADAKWWARFWGRVHSWGVMPRRWVTLEVPGRRTGLPMQVPLGMADLDDRWYVVSMLGECNWVRNVRANDGRAVLRHGRAFRCRFAEVPPANATPILQRYVDKVPGGRPHIPVPRGAPLADFATIADRHPVFEVLHDAPGAPRPWAPPRSWFPRVIVGVAVVCAAVRVVSHQGIRSPNG
jgi:deazaflavin-dependent oxidoreductase (nitroreductase family)